MPVVFRSFLEKLGGDATANTFVGNSGDLFYDPNTTTLRISDGVTPGGSVVSSGGSGISNVVEDTTPQLGGNLDVNGKTIGSTGGGNISIVADEGGDVILTATGDGIVSITGDVSVGGDVLMDGTIQGVVSIQPEFNSMAGIQLPADADADTTPLTIYSEGAAGIKIDGRLTGSVATVNAAATAPILDLLTPVVVLNYTGADQSYILPNGTFEGQMVYFVAIPSGTTYYHWSVNLTGNYRTVDAETVVTSGTLWYPWGETFFDGVASQPVDYNHESHTAYAIWAGNAWNVSRGTVNLT